MFRWKMKVTVKSMKYYLPAPEKMKLTGSNKTRDRFYVVTGWAVNTPFGASPGNWDWCDGTDALLPSLTTIKREN